MAAGTCYRSFFSERAIIEEFDVPSCFPLTQHVSCTGFAFVVLEPCIERIAIGEDAILVGNQFEQVSGSSARCLRHALGFTNLVAEEVQLEPKVIVQTPPAEPFDGFFPLHAVGGIEQACLAESVNERPMAEVVEDLVLADYRILVALGFLPLHQSAGRLADDVARSTIPEKQQNEKGKKSSSVTVMTDDSFYFDGVGRGIGWVLW